MSHMDEPPFGGALTPTIPRAAQSHFARRKAAVSFDSPRFAVRLRAMSRLLLSALLAVAVLSTLGACSHGKKSSAHIYEGNGPSIHFSDKPENAGGHINTY